MLRSFLRRSSVVAGTRAIQCSRSNLRALPRVQWKPQVRSLTADAEAFKTSQGGQEAKSDDDIRQEVLKAALEQVPHLGWTTEAIIAGAEKAGYPPMLQGVVTEGPAELVDFFMQDANQRLAEHLADRRDVMQHMSPRKRLRYAIEYRLRMVLPLRSKWSDAMALGAFPPNIPRTTEALALLADELAHAAGYKYDPVRAGATKWYLDRAVISAVYVATELFMLTDESEGNQDTWEFLERRLDGLERAESAVKVGNLKNLLTSTQTIAASLGSAVQSLLRNQMDRKE